MQKDDFNKVIAHLPGLLEIHSKELEELIERYPYFQLPYVLLAKKLHAESSPQFDALLAKAALHIYDRELLYQIIERTPLSRTMVTPDGELEEEMVTGFENILNNTPQTEKESLKEIEIKNTSEHPEEVVRDFKNSVLNTLKETPGEIKAEIPGEEILIPVKEESIQPVIEENSQPVTKEINEPVIEEIIQPVIEENSQPVTEEINEPVIEEIIQPVIEENSQPLTEEISEPIKEEIIQPVIEENSQPLTEEINKSIEEEIIHPAIEENSQPVTEEISESIKEEIIQPGIQENIQPLTEKLEPVEDEIILTEVEEDIQPTEELVTPEMEQVIPAPEIEEAIPPTIEEIESVEIFDGHVEEVMNNSVETDESAIEQEAAMEEKNGIEEDELELEYHSFDIEKEYGKLPEEEMINLRMPPPEEEFVVEDHSGRSHNFEGQRLFSEWLEILAGASRGKLVETDKNNLPKRVEPTGVPPKEVEFTEVEAEQLAMKSIQRPDDLLTETYARILAMQGKNLKAVDVYERLGLKYPDKLAYFASKIEELKKKD